MRLAERPHLLRERTPAEPRVVRLERHRIEGDLDGDGDVQHESQGEVPGGQAARQEEGCKENARDPGRHQPVGLDQRDKREGCEAEKERREEAEEKEGLLLAGLLGARRDQALERAEKDHDHADEQGRQEERGLRAEQLEEIDRMQATPGRGAVGRLKEERGKAVLRVPDVDGQHGHVRQENAEVGPGRLEPAAVRAREDKKQRESNLQKDARVFAVEAQPHAQAGEDPKRPATAEDRPFQTEERKRPEEEERDIGQADQRHDRDHGRRREEEQRVGLTRGWQKPPSEQKEAELREEREREGGQAQDKGMRAED